MENTVIKNENKDTEGADTDTDTTGSDLNTTCTDTDTISADLSTTGADTDIISADLNTTGADNDTISSDLNMTDINTAPTGMYANTEVADTDTKAAYASDVGLNTDIESLSTKNKKTDADAAGLNADNKDRDTYTEGSNAHTASAKVQQNEKWSTGTLGEIKSLACTIVAALISAFGMYYFVEPAEFAPAGLDGVATMIAKLLGTSPAWFILALNVPLIAVAWFVLKKRYVIYTLIFTFTASGAMLLFELFGVPQFTSAGDGLMAAIFSGALFGVRTGIMMRIGASSGGIDVIAGMITKKHPYLNIENIITVICYGIIGISYFVYDQQISSVLLSVVQMFVFERAIAMLLKESRNAIEVKIITKHPESLRDDIILNLKHGATIVGSRGMYTDEKSSVIISVINIRQIPEFFDILKKYPDTFAYYGEISGVSGNFRWKKTDVIK